MKIKKHRTGLAVGSFLGFVHLLWSAVVGFGWGQKVIDFIYSLHFIKTGWTINAFEWKMAAMLVVITSAVGYVLGWLFAASWNKFVKK